MTDATEALVLLDAGRLSLIAARLQSLLDSHTGLRTTAEITAGQRVFASVVRATDENINIIERIACATGDRPSWAR